MVALFFPMSADFVAAYFGVLYAGKQALPLNLLLPPEELKYILNDSGAGFIIAPPELARKVALDSRMDNTNRSMRSCSL